MSMYGEAAVKAVKLFTGGVVSTPRKAWENAIAECTDSLESRKESCPMSAFLGLCEDGEVKGIPRGAYTRSKLNKRYAIEALALLRKNPALAEDEKRLWSMVTEGETAYHGQMAIVISLLQGELIAPPPKAKQ